VASWFSQSHTGSVETGAAPWWRLVPKNVRVATVRRPVAEVADSLAALGFDRATILPLMVRLDRKLDQIERRVPDVLSVSFDELNTKAGIARIFEHCLPYQFDEKWWGSLTPVNMQIDMRAMVRYASAFRPQMEKIAAIAKRAIVTGFGPHKVIGREDVTLQQESCETWFRDGKRLFEEHAIQLGEAPDGYLQKNWNVMHAMDRLGCMQIITARCNGRMVGYYVCYLAPATDDASILSALQISIFVSKDFTGLATKLQRASIEALRAKGVGEVCFRAGVKADGARMATLYRRIGAEHIGQMYRLPLKAA
jgi:hypothetical protein